MVQSQIGGQVSGNVPALSAGVGQGQATQDFALARQRAARLAAGSAASEGAAKLLPHAPALGVEQPLRHVSDSASAAHSPHHLSLWQPCLGRTAYEGQFVSIGLRHVSN